MKKITALRAGGGGGKQVKVFLDGKFAFRLETGVAAREGLRIDQTLSAEQIETLTGNNQLSRCYNAATLYLSYRPRSELELRDRLHRRGFDGDRVDKVIARLKEQGLVDDTAFAQFWAENRESFSPRSQRLTRLELKQKGVAEDIIDQTVAAIDDEDSAYWAASRKARSLTVSDYQSFRRRLGGHLQRRGFSYGVINDTVERIWQDRPAT
ncbi:regulatory protein RecX [Chloroflexota bacterium]